MAKSLTIHRMDDALAGRISQKARQDHLSLNREVKQLLEHALGLRGSASPVPCADFREFCGAWEPEEVQRFEQARADFEKVDEADWR
jgi:hypothetical protein